MTVAHVPPSCLGGDTNNGNPVFDTIVGVTVTTTVFATIAVKASNMGHNKPASP